LRGLKRWLLTECADIFDVNERVLDKQNEGNDSGNL
jgi:hypothetical protein